MGSLELTEITKVVPQLQYNFLSSTKKKKKKKSMHSQNKLEIVVLALQLAERVSFWWVNEINCSIYCRLECAVRNVRTKQRIQKQMQKMKIHRNFQ